MKNTYNSFCSKTDFMILLLGFVLFLATVFLPTFFGYYSYSSDARSTYGGGGFQILDAIHAGQLPSWDPYNANGRDATCLTVGMGAFAPDFLIPAWIVDKLLPNIYTVSKSFIVNLIFRYFFIFGMGVWLLGRLLFRTRTALYYFWFVLVFGTPIMFPLSNQMLSQVLNYFPWILFFVLKFATTRVFWAILGFIVSLSTSFCGLSRDFPLLLFSVFIVIGVAIPAFWPLFSKLKFSTFSTSQWIMGLIALLVLLVLILSMASIGQQFLSMFSKKRFVADDIVVDLPLTEEIDQSGMIMIRPVPTLESLLFPFPITTVRYGCYFPGHSYFFIGLCGLTLLLFSFSGSSRRFSCFFALLIIIFFLAGYWKSFPLLSLLKSIIPGLKKYQYFIHLKYLALLCLVALEGIGLDNLILRPSQGKKKIIISIIILCLASVVLAWGYSNSVLAWRWSSKISQSPSSLFNLLILGTVLIVATRGVQAFSLLNLMDKHKITLWSVVLITCETFIAIWFLFVGDAVREFGWPSIKSDPMYFLRYRLNNFTLHAIDPPDRVDDLKVGTVYKVNFAKDEHLRMNGQSYAEKVLGHPQRVNLTGPDSPRLFLARKVKTSPNKTFSDTLSNSDPASIREIPVILDDGNLPVGLPLLLPGETPPQTDNKIKLAHFAIPRSSMKVKSLIDRPGWSKITVKGEEFSRHLSSNPWTIKQEKLLCYLNKKKVDGNWFMENVEISSRATFELNKSEPDLLTVVAPLRPEEVEELELEYRDTGGIHILDFGYNYLDLTYVTDSKRVLVYLDNYAEGWEASIDGNNTPIMQAYGAYKAILAPAGTHEVHFCYRPEKIILMWKFAFASYILLIILFVSSFFIRKRTIQHGTPM